MVLPVLMKGINKYFTWITMLLTPREYSFMYENDAKEHVISSLVHSNWTWVVYSFFFYLILRKIFPSFSSNYLWWLNMKVFYFGPVNLLYGDVDQVLEIKHNSWDILIFKICSNQCVRYQFCFNLCILDHHKFTLCLLVYRKFTSRMQN